MAIHVYRVLCASAVVLAGAFTATLLVSGGWQAVCAAIALMAGSAVLATLIVLRAMADAGDPRPAAPHLLPQPPRAETPEPAASARRGPSRARRKDTSPPAGLRPRGLASASDDTNLCYLLACVL